MVKIILLVILFASLNLAQPVAAQTGSVDLLLGRLQGAGGRLDIISQKIASRLEKMKADRINVTKLNTQYLNINKQLVQLKQQSTEAETLATSSGYKLFRQQVLEINTTLKAVLAAEKNLISQMKRMTSEVKK